MPPRPRTVYTAPVRAKRLCMICFRNVIFNYDPMAGELPVFRCRFATAATGKCMLCADRKKACVLPAEGMQGDSLDLEALLEWVTFYFDIARDADGNPDLDADGDEVYEHDTGFRAEICGAVLRLCTAFEATEKTHRSGLETTGAKKKKKAIECRLVPGDDGYQLWALAKRMFRGEVAAAVTSALGPA
ncbi:hypothetical protein DL764_007404 [Monosporascus ibericus]|uniref:Uncharacterized protein n=1 Tax=Monosporascus ibericus TaxID=155417 RepID=A0A4Q4T347_9PEZI|nr:hypothetical protein DL764_007404 [Monosporascus ibericus]